MATGVSSPSPSRSRRLRNAAVKRCLYESSLGFGKPTFENEVDEKLQLVVQMVSNLTVIVANGLSFHPMWNSWAEPGPPGVWHSKADAGDTVNADDPGDEVETGQRSMEDDASKASEEAAEGDVGLIHCLGSWEEMSDTPEEDMLKETSTYDVKKAAALLPSRMSRLNATLIIQHVWRNSTAYAIWKYEVNRESTTIMLNATDDEDGLNEDWVTRCTDVSDKFQQDFLKAAEEERMQLTVIQAQRIMDVTAHVIRFSAKAAAHAVKLQLKLSMFKKEFAERQTHLLQARNSLTAENNRLTKLHG